MKQKYIRTRRASTNSLPEKLSRTISAGDDSAGRFAEGFHHRVGRDHRGEHLPERIVAETGVTNTLFVAMPAGSRRQRANTWAATVFTRSRRTSRADIKQNGVRHPPHGPGGRRGEPPAARGADLRYAVAGGADPEGRDGKARRGRGGWVKQTPPWLGRGHRHGSSSTAPRDPAQGQVSLRPRCGAGGSTTTTTGSYLGRGRSRAGHFPTDLIE